MNGTIHKASGWARQGRAALVLVLLAALAAGCATSRNVEYDDDVAFEDFQTFAWAPPERTEVEDPVLDSGLLDRRVAKAVRDTLSDRGFREVEPEEADFVVSYHTSSRERAVSPNVRVHLSYGVGYPYYPAWYGSRHYPFQPYYDDSRSYQEGTLIIDVVDREKEELIWRGWRSGEVRQSRYSEEQVREQVRRILADFPPTRGDN